MILWRSLPDDVTIKIKSDKQLLEWFKVNIVSGIMFIDAEIKDFNGSLQFSSSRRWCHPKVRKTLIETTTSPCQPTQNERATNEVDTNERSKNMPTTNERDTKFKAHDVDDVLSDSNYDSDFTTSSYDDSDLEFDYDCEIVDEYDVHVFSYDQDDLEVEVGVIFLDIKDCKSAVFHHVILHDHAFHTIKMDTIKFIA
jgi:hypothetical protein